MELHDAIRRRAMVRSFRPDPVDPVDLDRILAAALRAPTAGNTAGTAWVVLNGQEQTWRYWEATTDEAWRSRSARWPGLQTAPVILLSYASAEAYLARYREDDKVTSGLGDDEVDWTVPYWTGDAAFAVMTVLLAAVDAGLGACVLGNFRGEDALATSLGVPERWRLFCAVVLGHPSDNDHRSASLDRPTPEPGERIHRGRW